MECEFASTEKRHFVKHVFGDERVGCQEEQHHAGHAHAANEHGAVIASANDSSKLGNEALDEGNDNEPNKHANAEERDVSTKGRLAAFCILLIDFARYEQRNSGERHHPNHAENQNEPHVEFAARGNGEEAEQRNCEKRSERAERAGFAVRQPANCDDAREKHEREGPQALIMAATWMESPMNDASLETNSEIGTVEAAPRRSIAPAARLLNDSIFARRSFESIVDGSIRGRSKRGLVRQDAATKARDAAKATGAGKNGKTKRMAQAIKTAMSATKVACFGARHIRHRSS